MNHYGTYSAMICLMNYLRLKPPHMMTEDDRGSHSMSQSSSQITLVVEGGMDVQIQLKKRDWLPKDEGNSKRIKAKAMPQVLVAQWEKTLAPPVKSWEGKVEENEEETWCQKAGGIWAYLGNFHVIHVFSPCVILYGLHWLTVHWLTTDLHHEYLQLFKHSG